MSPVFRHGRLRLYLLKLLDESPRHGYEVIRLLQDRFMGVYAPSPGTIYPRLARLEEEGLVTHDEAAGRKVYRITDRGREELSNRASDLSELEDEISASVRDIAREVTQDVRETVRNLREELTFAARDMHRHGPPPPRAGRGTGAGSRSRNGAGSPGRESAGSPGPESAGSPGREGAWPGGSGWADPGAYRDLEQVARRFTRELRAAAAQAQAVSEDAVDDLRTILDDTLDRIKAEVFGRPGTPRPDTAQPGAGRPGTSQPGGAQPEAAPETVSPDDGPADVGDPGHPR